MIEAEYHLMLSSVYASSLATLSPSSLIAAKHVHGGGLSTGWIVAIVIGLALVALLVYTSSSGHPGSDESEPDEQTLPPNELVQRLEFLGAEHYRNICFWLAQSSSIANRGSLYEALQVMESYPGEEWEE